jgi:hypothetical protein
MFGFLLNLTSSDVESRISNNPCQPEFIGPDAVPAAPSLARIRTNRAQFDDDHAIRICPVIRRYMQVVTILSRAQWVWIPIGNLQAPDCPP